MSSEKGASYRRRRYIIDPRFQWKFGIWLMADVFVVSLFMGILLLIVQGRYVRSLMLEGQAFDWADMAVMLIVFALSFAVVAAGAFGVWSVMVTHRLCGPLHVIGTRLAEVAQGRFPRRRPLRKKDECKGLWDQLWMMIDSLKSRKHAEFDALTEILTTVRSAANQDDKARKAALDAVANRVAEMRTAAAEALGIESDDLPAVSKPKQDPAPRPVALCGQRGDGTNN
jgi:hypothetical protein